MKYFTHHDADAVAVCKPCGRGVCAGCAMVATDNSVSCSPRCAETAARLGALISKSTRHAKATQNTQAIVLGIMGLATVFAGFVATGVGRGVLWSAAAFLLLVALRYGRLARTWKQAKGE